MNAAGLAFQRHLDDCDHCRSFPHALCRGGQAIVERVSADKRDQDRRASRFPWRKAGRRKS